MRLPLRRSSPPRRARVASAAPATERSGDLRRLSQPWQVRVMGHYDTTEVCWYPAQFYSRAMERIRFFPAVLEDGEPVEVEEGPVVDLWDRVQDPGGGRVDLTGAYGRLMFLIGDGYLVVSEQDGAEAWEFLSPLELKVLPESGPGRPQEYRRIRAPGITPEELFEAPDEDFEPMGNEATVWRLWRRHPVHSQWADSPCHAVLDLFELLGRLTAAAGAEAISRAATRGAFYVPEDVEFVSLEGSDEDMESTPFFERLIASMMAAIKDPNSASAMMPILLKGPALANTTTGQLPFKDLMGRIAIANEDARFAETDAWDKVIDRIGGGLDMPREMVAASESVGGVNHWQGWLLDEQGFRQHIANTVERFCTDMASVYLRPAALDLGVAGAENVTVWYDPANAINHPDESDTAREAYRDGVVSSDYYRDKIGATDDDKPTDEDLELILLLQGRQPPGEDTDGETSPDEGGTGADTDEEPPEMPETANGNAPSVTAAMILGYAEGQVDRAREKAGASLVNRSKGCEPCRQVTKDVPHALVAAALGPDLVREIIDGHTTEAALVAGAGQRLAVKARQWGVNGVWPDELGRRVEQHALRTLYERETPRLPAGFAAAVRKALAA